MLVPRCTRDGLREILEIVSQALVVVPTTEEAEGILDLLKELHDVRANGFDVELNRAIT